MITTTIDGNEACADVAYRCNEVIAIYPITPASPMGEHADAWSAHGRRNVWNAVPQIAELQSEGGAAGAVHGALQAGSLATTFTASQGLLLMLPNMYKIAGELTPAVLHIAARSVATHALSIFGDHSDVYAARGVGFAMLASSGVQQAHDFSLVAQAASLESRVPFLHFFDGFRTSHEVAKIARLADEDIRALIDERWITAHRGRALDPDHPVVRGTAQNPDTFFQAREAVNPFYDATIGIVERTLAKFGERTGRHYGVVDYAGHFQAKRVIVLMGSAAETAMETARYLENQDEPVGVVRVNLYRPFPAEALLAALPDSVERIAVLDRHKEPGAPGEPLYLDVLSALQQAWQHGGRAVPRVVGGRYGLSSKELTPGMVKGVFDELAKERPKHGFTVGIVDDVTHTSLDYDHELDIEGDEVVRAIFFGLGSDGTVGANKNSIKIIGGETELHAQGYFVYDSKKAGARTVSHLRFGPRPIHAPYLIERASFVACHQWQFLERYDVLDHAADGAVFLLNSPYGKDEVWSELPRGVRQQILDKKLRFYVIDGYQVAEEAGMGRRINTIMQTCFFAISEVLPRDEAIGHIKGAIEKSYGRRGRAVVERNFRAVDQTLAHLERVELPGEVGNGAVERPLVPDHAPAFVREITLPMMLGKGDHLPVSAFPADGTWPTGTTRWEKRNIALEIPLWDAALCIQCNKCALVCPHAAIRAKVYPPKHADGAPSAFVSQPFKSKDIVDHDYALHVAPEDCTGCTLCVEVCPARDKSNPRHKAIDMVAQAPIRDEQRESYDFFLSLPEADRSSMPLNVKHSQLLEPLFEYSGACAGCGETPYIKLLTQLFGDRVLIANATGCSSIYGGNLPTTPYTTNADGRGPAWSNSLFEDNAEFGFGMRLSLDQHGATARGLVESLASELDGALVAELLGADQSDEAGIAQQRERVARLTKALAAIDRTEARRLEPLAGYLVDKSVWIVGGDGWAYDIGYGGLDHVLASGKNVNILVLDTEVYSNTGGQQSKATPLGAVAKFASAGKDTAKKDLSMLAMAYGNVYVARVAFGADDRQTLRAFLEAQSYPGPSIIIAYSHCIAHGYDMAHGLEQQKLAVQSAYWPLLRYDPRRRDDGHNPLTLDSKAPKKRVEDFAYNETRFRLLLHSQPERAKELMARAEDEAQRRWHEYSTMAKTER